MHFCVVIKLADVVAKPLSIIYEKSWEAGEVPVEGKRGTVTCIFKKEKKFKDSGSYRPISPW